jgi:Tfp pilus assembly protein PilO
MTLLLYYGGLAPLMRERDSTLAHRDELKARQENASSLAASVARVRSQLNTVREAIDKTPLKLQPSRLVNTRLAELTELATAQGLQIEHVEPSPSRAAGRYEIVPLRMAGMGRFPTCVQFLHKLRSGFPDTGIAGFQLSGNPSAAGTGRFELELHWFATPSRQDEARTDLR